MAATRTRSSATRRTGHAAAAAATGGEDGRHAAFELNAQQYDFVFDDAHKYCAYIGGLGAGKSFAGAVKALRYMVEHPGSLGVIGAPTYPMLRDSTLRTVAEVFPRGSISYTNKTDGIIRLHNGSEALLRSMDDPDARRGPNLSWCWLDEGPLCGYYAWKVVKGRIRVKQFPARAWITGTPKGQDEFYEDFELHPDAESHALYRASTRDNAHNLADHYIEDMGYTGQFALQEIEGLFVKFEGLVYDFHSEWHLGEWEGVGPDGNPLRPRLKIGGVDWGRTNPAVALPIYVRAADDRVYVLDEFYERGVGFMGDRPVVGEGGLSRAVLQFSRDYGIETWYCGPDEPEHIAALNALFGRSGVKARAVAAADEIVPGIETVTGALALRPDGTAGFQMSARCAQTKAELRTYSYPKASEGDKRDPADRPIKKFDHAMDACLVAGTPVLTEGGWKPIEHVQTGERVWTRDGLRRTLFAGMTDADAEVWAVELSDGTQVQGTWHHRFWVQDFGWRHLGNLQPCDTLYTSSDMEYTWGGICRTGADKGALNTSCITASPTTAILMPRHARIASTSTRRKVGRSTVRCGRWSAGQSHQVTTSTTATETPRTIPLRTWSACTGTTTLPAISRPCQPRLPAVHARSAAGHSRRARRLHGDSVSVLMPANRRGDERKAQILSPVSASYVALTSRSVATQTPRPADVHVVRVYNTHTHAPVYDLTVEDTPEFFASGVLVHNCRYALHSALGGKTRHRGFTQEQAQRLNPQQPVSRIGGIRILKKTF